MNDRTQYPFGAIYAATVCPMTPEAQIDERACFDAIDLAKDVDGVPCLGFHRWPSSSTAHVSQLLISPRTRRSTIRRATSCISLPCGIE